MQARVSATLAGCLVALVTGSAEAALWRVQKDGSGDFTQIQDAIDAAAAGDTVSIGPGTWQDTHDVELPGGTTTLLAWVPQTRLTVVGAGADPTTLSVPDGPGTFDSPWGVITGLNTVLHVESIRFENLQAAVLANGDAVVVQDCDFRFNFEGLDSWAPDSTRVRRSTFFDNKDAGVIVFRNLGAKDVVIEDCTFEEGGVEIDLQSQSSLVRNCTFTNSTVGVQTSLGGQARAENCRFTSMVNVGAGLLDASSLEVLNCTFRLGRGADVYVSNGCHLVGSGNVLGGAKVSSLRITLSATVDFHGNHILNGGGFSVDLAGSPPITSIVDLSNNYWGTTDRAQIDGWILDKNDTAAINGFVDYEPIAEQPLATDAKSFSALKSLFSPNR